MGGLGGGAGGGSSRDCYSNAHSLAAIVPTILIAPRSTIGTYVSVPTYRYLPMIIIHMIRYFVQNRLRVHGYRHHAKTKLTGPLNTYSLFKRFKLRHSVQMCRLLNRDTITRHRSCCCDFVDFIFLYLGRHDVVPPRA